MRNDSQKQEPPFAVQIELVEGCNLRCPFCGLNGIRGKDNDYKMMTVKTLRSAIEQMVELGWNPRIEFAMHGEPTMHEDPATMIATVRANAPKFRVMMTSNGGGLLSRPGPSSRIASMFDAGLNCLALDDYQHANIVPKIRAALERQPLGESVKIYEYPENKDGNPHSRSHRSSLVYIQAIDTASTGTHSHLNNHAGSGAPPNRDGQGKRCAKPFRELSIRWDGSVAICCNDWRGTYKCGNVVKDGLEEVWNGSAMRAARQKLYCGERDFGPCAGCDARSDRVGLLPDKYGKKTLPKPDASTLAEIDKATRGRPLTAPVLREWETKR